MLVATPLVLGFYSKLAICLHTYFALLFFPTRVIDTPGGKWWGGGVEREGGKGGNIGEIAERLVE